VRRLFSPPRPAAGNPRGELPPARRGAACAGSLIREGTYTYVYVEAPLSYLLDGAIVAAVQRTVYSQLKQPYIH